VHVGGLGLTAHADGAVPQREERVQRTASPVVTRLFARDAPPFIDARLIDACLVDDELGHLGHDVIGAGAPELRGAIVAVDRDDRAKAAAPRGLHPSERVLDEERAARRHPEQLRREEERRGIGLAGQAPLTGAHTVHDDGDKAVQPCRREHRPAVPARRHDRDRPAVLDESAHERGCPRQGLHPLGCEELVEASVLAAPETVDGGRRRGIVRIADRHDDAARGEERRDAVFARLAVDVPQVVTHRIERRRSRVIREHLREEVTPRPRVQPRGVREHAVEIEHRGIDLVECEARVAHARSVSRFAPSAQ
jgi:hypothetical protein